MHISGYIISDFADHFSVKQTCFIKYPFTELHWYINNTIYLQSGAAKRQWTRKYIISSRIKCHPQDSTVQPEPLSITWIAQTIIYLWLSYYCHINLWDVIHTNDLIMSVIMSVSNHQPYDCLLNRLFKRRSKKTSKLCIIGLCAGN